jgi:hypothetical protein
MIVTESEFIKAGTHWSMSSVSHASRKFNRQQTVESKKWKLTFLLSKALVLVHSGLLFPNIIHRRHIVEREQKSIEAKYRQAPIVIATEHKRLIHPHRVRAAMQAEEDDVLLSYDDPEPGVEIVDTSRFAKKPTIKPRVYKLADSSVAILGRLAKVLSTAFPYGMRVSPSDAIPA